VLPHQAEKRPPWHCATPPGAPDDGADLLAMRPSRAVAGDLIRTYRIAIATTGEYTDFHGGTVESGLGRPPLFVPV